MKKILIIIFAGLMLNISAQSNISSAQAMFIYNFTKLIENPNKVGNYVIGFIGSSETYEQMLKLSAGRLIGNQSISVQKFNNASDISICQILFISSNKTKELSNILPKLQDKNTLIVTEKDGAINDGSAINFVVVNDRLKFEIKPDNITKYQIKIENYI